MLLTAYRTISSISLIFCPTVLTLVLRTFRERGDDPDAVAMNVSLKKNERVSGTWHAGYETTRPVCESIPHA
jgi:hypothetical protein